MSKQRPPKPKINGLIYDIEIINCIPEKNPKDNESGYNYCKGWHDHAGMGIATVCVYDFVTQMPRIFGKGNFKEMVELFANRDEIIGFNTAGFDDKVLTALQMPATTTYDLSKMVRFACGEPEVYTKGKSRGGMTQDDLLRDNGLPPKYMKGDMAPKLWQKGFPNQVIDYCMGDVMLLHGLFRKRRNLYVGAYKKNVCLPELESLKEWRREDDEWLDHNRRGEF